MPGKQVFCSVACAKGNTSLRKAEVIVNNYMFWNNHQSAQTRSFSYVPSGIIYSTYFLRTAMHCYMILRTAMKQINMFQ